MQARQSNGLQSRRTAAAARGTKPLAQIIETSARERRPVWPSPYPIVSSERDAPGAAVLQEGARTTNFRVGHGAGTGPLP